jgi:hypothetical protein
MPYQNPNSDITVLVVILLIAIFIFIRMLIATFAVLRSENSIKNEARPKDEIKSSSPAERSAKFLPKEKPKIELEFSQRAIRLIWGIPLTAALMSGLILALLYAYRKAVTLPGFWNVFDLWLPNLTVIGTAVGGAIGLRIASLSWRQIIAAALLAGASLIVSARFISSLLFLSDPFLLIFVPAGVFLLPLFDATVRKTGPAPSSWKVALAAFFLSLLIIWANVFRSPVGIFVLILPGMGVILGLMLSLSSEKNLGTGAWVGGLAVLVPFFLLAILLLGRL